jgi:hypothetical protein
VVGASEMVSSVFCFLNMLGFTCNIVRTYRLRGRFR